MRRYKVTHAETKDLGEGRVLAVMSTELKDRDGDILRVAGWNLDSFQAHPVLMSSHNYGDLQSQIGEWQDAGV